MRRSWLLLAVIALPSCERGEPAPTRNRVSGGKAIALTWADYDKEVASSAEPVLLDFMSKG